MKSSPSPLLRAAGLRPISLLAAGLLLAPLFAFGQTSSGTANSSADGDWYTSGTWGTIKASNSVSVNIYHNVTLGTDVPALRTAYTALIIGDASNANGNGSLTLTSGGKIAFTGTTVIARNIAGANVGDGLLTIDGGIFSAAGINLGSGTANTATAKITVENGGTLSASGSFNIGGSGTTAGQYGLLEVIGSDNSLSLSGLAVRNGQLAFVADMAGVSTLTVSGNTLLNDVNSRLFIDGTAYTGGSTEWTLIDSNASTSDFGFATLLDRTTFAGFDPSLYSVELFYDSANYDLKLQISTIAVPEPSTYGVLAGVIALGVAFYRRRRALS